MESTEKRGFPRRDATSLGSGTAAGAQFALVSALLYDILEPNNVDATTKVGVKIGYLASSTLLAHQYLYHEGARTSCYTYLRKCE